MSSEKLLLNISDDSEYMDVTGKLIDSAQVFTITHVPKLFSGTYTKFMVPVPSIDGMINLLPVQNLIIDCKEIFLRQ